MITKSHRRLMEEVRKAYEHQCGVAEAWMRSGRPQALLARVHDEIEAGERDRDSRERTRLPRIAWAAFGFAIIAVVVVVAALVASGTSPGRPVASVATIAPIAGETEYLTKETVIEEIAALFEDYPGVVRADPGIEPVNVLQTAQYLGLVRGEEAVGFNATLPATRGEFALWIWRAWHLVLPEATEIPVIADLEGSGDEEGRRAIRIAVTLDILALDAKGAFRAAENLTVEDATKAFSRLYVLLADG